MSEKWSKEFDSCFQVGSIEEIADALEKRSGSEENALAMLAMTAGFAPIFPDTCYHLTHYWPAAADIPV
ncbi:hypothetical protein OU660_28720, partial [Escherichia coli]|nr:hypothetical protein [Escherichia coli]